jgi:hypothetical protein
MLTSGGPDPARHFRMLERTADLIARHPAYPGKGEAVRRCREDIEQRFRRGSLTEEQRDRLMAILDEGGPG